MCFSDCATSCPDCLCINTLGGTIGRSGQAETKGWLLLLLLQLLLKLLPLMGEGVRVADLQMLSFLATSMLLMLVLLGITRCWVADRVCAAGCPVA